MIRILAILLILLSGLSPARAIVGATAAKDPDGVRRHTVAIILERGLCSGVLIAQDMVLTAAHCFAMSKPKRIVMLDEQFKARFLAIKHYVSHQSFKPAATPMKSAGVDLAIVHLAAPAPEDMTPVALGHFHDRGDVFLAGFGLNSRSRDRVGTLHGAFLRARIVDWKSHRLIAAIGVEGSEAKFGTGGCRGDSGGPLFEPNSRAVVGIVSWSSGPPGQKMACGGLTVATEVGDQRDWIAQTITQLRARAAQ